MAAGDVPPDLACRLMSGADSTVELVPYDPRWPERFAAAAEQLRRVFPSAQIEHIGSTSVVGLSSKDTVDIAVGVPGVAECLTGDVLAALAELGFSFVPASFADDPDHAFPDERTATLIGWPVRVRV